MASSNRELWVSDNPPWGIVRAVVIHGPYAIVLDDLNGDTREVCADFLRRRQGGWESLTYSDDAGLPTHEGGLVSCWVEDTVYILGHGHPGSEVTLPLGARDRVVRCDEDGWWLYVEEGVVGDDDGHRPLAQSWWIPRFGV